MKMDLDVLERERESEGERRREVRKRVGEWVGMRKRDGDVETREVESVAGNNRQGRVVKERVAAPPVRNVPVPRGRDRNVVLEQSRSAAVDHPRRGKVGAAKPKEKEKANTDDEDLRTKYIRKKARQVVSDGEQTTSPRGSLEELRMSRTRATTTTTTTTTDRIIPRPAEKRSRSYSPAPTRTSTEKVDLSRLAARNLHRYNEESRLLQHRDAVPKLHTSSSVELYEPNADMIVEEEDEEAYGGGGGGGANPVQSHVATETRHNAYQAPASTRVVPKQPAPTTMREIPPPSSLR
ncbi:hypothetical protein HK104_007774, partial [Borealophlyctis nickersoniae]